MAGKILILTQEVDPHADFMVDTLARRGITPVRIHTKKFPLSAQVTTSASSSEGFQINLNFDERARGDEIKSVWYRRPDKCDVGDGLSESEKKLAEVECQATLSGLYRTLGGFWVNSVDRSQYASSKARQLQRAVELGLRIPDTIITNDPEELTRFYHKHGGKIIFKTQKAAFFNLEEHLSFYTSMVDASKMEKADLIRRCPAIFQEYIEKDHELRITIIGRRIFAVELRSQLVEAGKVDYRKAMELMEHIPTTLPRDISKKIIEMMDGFQLQYGAIDMIVTPNGEHIFLEINPDGQFGWIEIRTGLPLYDTMADLLIAGAPIS